MSPAPARWNWREPIRPWERTTLPPNQRATINNYSAAAAGVLVSSGNQQVGGINGAGNVQVTPPAGQSASLTADHITAGSLVIGGDATSAAVVTIAASNSDGAPLAQSSGFAVASSLTPNAPIAASALPSSGLLAADGSSSDGLSLGGSTSANLNIGSSVAAVPEPSAIILLAFGSLICLLTPCGARSGCQATAIAWCPDARFYHRGFPPHHAPSGSESSLGMRCASGRSDAPSPSA